jgi:two-component system phosphate regulon sensor histidine kinase PhoR
MTAQPAAKIVPGSAELEHERLKSLINSMADGVIATDAHTKIVLCNGAALNILDINSPIQGRRLSSTLKLVDKNNQHVDLTELVLNTKTQTVNRDLRLRYPDTSTINLYLSIAPVHIGYGADGGRGYVLLMRDITHEKSLEEERNEFISVVSHELRTPVAIAEGNLSNAAYLYDKTTHPSKTVLEALHQAHTQILFLSGLINDLSTLSRAERDKLKLEIEPINPHKLIEELVKTYGKDAEAKGLRLHTDLDPSLELLQSSYLYVQEILQNFMTNAIKYTEDGTITIGANAKPRGVEFFVRDSGIGISKPDQEKVFDKFFRSEDYRIRQTSGTGLGLYVTMKLARLLHADLDLTSELNKGSTFRIFVPNLK